MKRGLIILAGLGVLLILVVVFINIFGGKTPDSKSALKIWLPFDEVATYKKISKEFQTKHPSIDLEFKYIDAKDAKDYEATVINAIADGVGPDIWLARFDWIPKHAAKSLSASAGGLTDATTQLKVLIQPNIVDLNTYNGELYGVPLFADSLAIIYNSDYYRENSQNFSQKNLAFLDQYPTSWAELKRNVGLISTNSGSTIKRSGLALGTVKNTFAPADVLTAFLLQSNSTILSEDGKDVIFNLAAFKKGKPTFPTAEALAFYTSFASSKATNYSWNATMGDPVKAFVAGKTGAVIGYYSTLQEILEQDPTIWQKIIVTPMVQKNPKAERVDFVMGWTHLVNRDSTAPTAAWQYLAYLAQDTAQYDYAESTGRIEVAKRDRGLAERSEANMSRDEIFAAQFDTGSLFIKREWQLVDVVLQDAINQVIVSHRTAQNAVDSAASRFKVFLQDASVGQ